MPRDTRALTLARLAVVLLIALGVSTSATRLQAQSNPTGPAGTDDQQLRALNADWLGAYRTRDAATFERILAPEFVTTMPSGARLDRAAVIRGATGPSRVVTAIGWDQLDVRIYGAAAVVSGRATFNTEGPAGPATANTLYTDVYVRRDGGWVAVAAHVSRANP